MPLLPSPRGPLSEALIAALAGAPGTLPPLTVTAPSDPLADDDLHLALYVLYELHYRGFEGVDDRWEWDPGVLRVRQKLESCFEEALRTELDRDKPPTPSPPELADHLKLLLGSTEGPSLSR